MNETKSIESYIASKEEWKEALLLLRKLVRSTSLDETLKWGMPVYTLDNKNVVGISAFKYYVGIWFYQGVFLTDSGYRLINAQEGVTKAMRQWRFTSLQEIQQNQKTILEYLEEAIRNQKEGKEIKPERNKALELPPELQSAFAKDPKLKEHFEALSLTNRRSHAEYIRSAKREETRKKRLEKVIPMIFEGIGLNDKYKS